MTQRFEKAYNALYNSFMNNTLAKGSCRACAVGNIVADAMEGKILINDNIFECTVPNIFWANIFYTSEGKQNITRNYICEEKIKKITDYSWEEMAKIEFAFETNTKIYACDYHDHSERQIMEDQFKGLMAVMDVLIELDEVKEGETYKDNFKNKFVSIN